MIDSLMSVLEKYDLITSFSIVGITIFIAYVLSNRLTMVDLMVQQSQL